MIYIIVLYCASIDICLRDSAVVVLFAYTKKLKLSSMDLWKEPLPFLYFIVAFR